MLSPLGKRTGAQHILAWTLGGQINVNPSAVVEVSVEPSYPPAIFSFPDLHHWAGFRRKEVIVLR